MVITAHVPDYWTLTVDSRTIRLFRTEPIPTHAIALVLLDVLTERFPRPEYEVNIYAHYSQPEVPPTTDVRRI